MSDITNLLKEIKAYRNDMVARNYPYQQLSDIITKWEEHLSHKADLSKEMQESAKPVSQEEWLDGYNKWKSKQ